MEKYGFVYIWFDKKHRRFYIGCRWGNIKDGYICSSSWMKQAYKHRPEDFKRRILKTNIRCRKETLETEFRYLAMIKEFELGTKYYNLSKRHFGHWSSTSNKDSVSQKISESPLRNQRISASNKGRKVSEKTRSQISGSVKKLWENNEYREAMSLAHIGNTHSKETRYKISEAGKGRIFTEESRKKIGQAHRGKLINEETISKMKKSQSNRGWYHSVSDNKDLRCKLDEIPAASLHKNPSRNTKKSWMVS